MVIIVSVLKFSGFLGLNGFKLMNFLSEKAADQQALRRSAHGADDVVVEVGDERVAGELALLRPPGKRAGVLAVGLVWWGWLRCRH